MQLKFKRLNEDAFIPTRGTENSSGLDLYAIEDCLIRQGEIKLIKTGIAFQIPKGFEIQVRPRSGLSLKSPLMIKNSPGTVDQDYTGECSVIMVGLGMYMIKRGDRIAQAVLCPVEIPELVEVSEFSGNSNRGINGFGSTGK